MPLGIEQNSIAPQLIQNSGQSLVQGIRQIGQQISGHLTELQTRRDLGAMAQGMQGLNVQSNDFPVQLTQLLAQHPLAARDERGQMLLSTLGRAHAQWQAGEAEARAFNRAMSLQQMRAGQSMADAAYQESLRRSRPTEVTGVGLVDPSQVDPVTGQPKVLVAAPPKTSSAMPFSSSPQGIYDRRTGQVIAPKPALPQKGATEYQKWQMRRAERNDRISAINQEINQFDSDIKSAEQQYNKLFEMENKAKPAEKARFQADKTEMGKIADQLKAEKQKRLELLRKMREEDTTDKAPAEESADLLPALPTPPDAAAAPAAPAAQFRSPDDVRAAVKSGALPKEQGIEILKRSFGFQ